MGQDTAMALEEPLKNQWEEFFSAEKCRNQPMDSSRILIFSFLQWHFITYRRNKTHEIVNRYCFFPKVLRENSVTKGSDAGFIILYKLAVAFLGTKLSVEQSAF